MGVRLERGAITMKARAFWKAVTVDREEFLDRFLEVLRAGGFQYCLVGGQAVNAYAEPVVSLDLDVVVVADQLEALERCGPRSIRPSARASARRIWRTSPACSRSRLNSGPGCPPSCWPASSELLRV